MLPSSESRIKLSKLSWWGDAGKQSEPGGFAYLVTNMLVVLGDPWPLQRI